MQAAGTAGDAGNRQHQTDELGQYLSFMLGGKPYGLAILNIKELIEYSEVTEIPMTPDFIAGVINLRGSVVPVIDLKLRFSGETTKISKRTTIIILEIKTEDLRIEVGVMVDLVNEVLDIPQSDIEPSPSMGDQIQTNFISGMAKVDGDLLIILDIKHVLSIEEISIASNIQSSNL